MRKKWQPGCPCCVLDCETIVDCFDAVGSTANRDVEVTITGLTDEDCTDCDAANTDFVISSGHFNQTDDNCGARYVSATEGDCDLFVDVSIGFGPQGNPGVWVFDVTLTSLLFPSGGVSFAIVDEADVQEAVELLCSGGDVDVPPFGSSVGKVCIHNSATCTVRLL